jgi:acetyltransferase-like isoleucine patch superfamily enzyme
MRKITAVQIAAFLALFLLAAAAAVASTAALLGRLPLGDFRGVALTLACVLLFYVYAIALYRIFLRLFPLRAGEIALGSQQEFVYHVYVLFYLLLFYPFILSGILPAPLARTVYIALGARLGDNTYSQGIILDPPFVTIGANSVVGLGAILCPHIIEGKRLAHYPIVIGDNVTIAGTAIVMSDVVIGDGATVAVGAVVAKGSRIGPGEYWSGNPARPRGVRAKASAENAAADRVES